VLVAILNNNLILNNIAEQELIKHTKKALKILGDKKSAIWHKLLDFISEIAIIVFAISLSIWVHNWSEHKNEQKVVKIFLLGLKADLQADVTETKEILGTYQQYKKLYSYLSGLDKNKIPNKDSLKTAFFYMASNRFLRPHESRFNGFLSAGKIMTIENDSLTQNILNYYQNVLPTLQTSEQVWLSKNTSLNDYVTDNVKDFENDMDKFQVLTTPKGKHLTNRLIPWPQLLERNQAVIVEANKIISKINKMYPDSK